MLYLKWLVDRNGNRVTPEAAIDAFREKPDDDQAVLTEHGWSFVPVAGLLNLTDGVQLLIAQAEWEEHLKRCGSSTR